MSISYLEDLIEALSKFKFITNKQAQRIALELVAKPELKDYLISELTKLQDVILCKNCNNIANDLICKICKEQWRNRHQIVVVNKVSDIYKFEENKLSNGIYFVLQNLISANNPDQNSIDERQLLDYLTNNEAKEVIIALDPTVDGELTANYLAEQIKLFNKKIKVFRLAYGMGLGLEIENTDAFSLRKAVENKKKY